MSKMKYIDIHGHINFPDYDSDRGEVIERARQAGVGMIAVGTDIESSRRAIVLAQNHEDIWVTVGIHPNDTDSVDIHADMEILSKLANDKKVVTIGECGLDYFRSPAEVIPYQKKLFMEQIILANKVGKPLMLHVRNGKKVNAYQEAIEILKENAKVGFNFHFFAGTVEDLKMILDIGGYVSFTGVLTFTRDYDELVKYVPLDSIMSETDCPFVAPAPHRGQRNEPAYVVETVKAIAGIRGEEEAVVAEKLVGNAVKFFNL